MRWPPGLGTLTWSLYGYDVFISYAHDDWRSDGSGQRHLPKELHARLSTGLRVFFDEVDHRVGDALDEATRRHVRASRQLVLLAGPKAMTSRWVLAEVQAALEVGRPVVVVDASGDFERAAANHPLRRAIGERIDVRRGQRTDDELTAAAVSQLLASTQGSTVERRRHGAVRLAAAVLAVAAVLAAGQSLRQSVTAVESADRARSEQAQRAAVAQDYPGAAMLLRDMQTDDAVPGWRSLALTALLFPHPAWSSEAALVATDAPRERVALWDGDAGLVVRRIGTTDPPLVLAPPTGQRWADLGTPQSGGGSVQQGGAAEGVFSGDGRYLLVRFRRGATLLWKLDSPGAPLLSWKSAEVNLSPDGTRLLAVLPAVSSAAGRVELRSLAAPGECLYCGPVSIEPNGPLWWGGSGVVATAAEGGLWHVSAAGARRLTDRGAWKFNHDVTADGAWYVTREHDVGTPRARLTFHPVEAAAGRAAVTLDTVFGTSMDDSLPAQGPGCAVAAGADGRLRVFRTDLGSLQVLAEPDWGACRWLGPAAPCRVHVVPGCRRIVAQWGHDAQRLPAGWLVDLATGATQALPRAATDRAGFPLPRRARVIDKFEFTADGRLALLAQQEPTDLVWNLDANTMEPVLDARNGIDRNPGRGITEGLARDGRFIVGQRARSADALLWSVDRLDEPRWFPNSGGATAIDAGRYWLTLGPEGVTA